MSRAVLFRIYVLAAIAVAVAAVVCTFSVESWTTIETLLFYAALVAVAAWVRVDDDSPGLNQRSSSRPSFFFTPRPWH
jgi:hypothetical protein